MPRRAASPASRFRIVGSGPEWSGAARAARPLGLGTTVALLGDSRAAGLAEEYVNADCSVCRRCQEGFGIVFLEAMAAGLPVVACRAAAVPEVVADGVTGLLVPDRVRPDASRSRWSGCSRSPRLAGRLGAAGRARVDAFDLVPGHATVPGGGARSAVGYSTRRFTFSAGHRYWVDEWTREENARTFG